MKVATVVGTRPQFIKAAVVSRVLRERHREILIHTGQHYDSNMSGLFFSGLNIPVPDYHLRPGTDAPWRQLKRMFTGIKEVLELEKPDLVLVYGDSRTTLAGSLAASVAGIPLGHVEAGLRSYDLSMPEELNRLVADRLATVLFCPSQIAVQNLLADGWGCLPRSCAPPDNPFERSQSAGIIFNVGDVGQEALINIRRSGDCVPPPALRGTLKPGEYLLATVHRAVNTDSRSRLGAILAGLAGSGAKVVLPAHPRTIKKIKAYGFEHYLCCPGLTVLEPVSYPEMIWLVMHAARVVTDSGGLQREAFLLRVPCITLRQETEWVETVARGCNVLVDGDPEQIANAAEMTFNGDWSGFPYGRGDASRLIAKALEGYPWPA